MAKHVNIRSLSGCPLLVSEIIAYIVDETIIHFNISTYLALQRGIDTTWAHETQRCLRKALQHMQAALAQDCDYVLAHPCVSNNPFFLHLTTIDDIGRCFRKVAKEVERRPSFAYVLLSYVRKVREIHEAGVGPWFPFRSPIGVLRYRKCLDDDDVNWEVMEDIEYATNDDAPEKFHFGLLDFENDQAYVIRLQNDSISAPVAAAKFIDNGGLTHADVITG
jgi:hypothetical protein